MSVLEFIHLGKVHAESLMTLWGDIDVIKYTNIKEPCTLGEIAERISRLSAYDVFAVKYNGEIVGAIGCPEVDRDTHKFGMFYQFKKQYWNMGIATNSVDWLLKYMKDKYSYVVLYADVVTDNKASEKILKHFGFEFISSENNAFECDGVKMNINQYKLIL